MKVLPFKIPRNNGELVVMQQDRGQYIYNTLHQHSELQMTLVRESYGTAVIGGHIGEFKAGDVFIIGSNIPHAFRNDDIFHQEDKNLAADVVYIFMDEGLPKTELLNLRKVRDFFTNARKGIKLVGAAKEKIGRKINEMINLEGLDKVVSFLQIINYVSQSSELVFLNKESANIRVGENDGKRLNDVVQFTFENYDKKISLEEISNIANMAPSAFCRFFKQRTRKTYFDFLNEIRVKAACKLLHNKDLTIVEICYKSGFNNLSYFNRKFKSITSYSPLKYHNALKGE